MIYAYTALRPQIFTEEGAAMLYKVQQQVDRCIEVAGAVRASEAWAGVAGDSWAMLACLDRLVELGHIREVSGPNEAGQHRVFVSAKMEG